MEPSLHPAAAHHLPIFIMAPGDTDVLFALVLVILVGSVLMMGVFFLWLHSLPERMVHNKIQFDIVAVLCLLSLFTHVHAFWVAALLLAVIKFPDFSASDFLHSLRRIAGSLEKTSDTGTDPLRRIAGSLEKMAGAGTGMPSLNPSLSGNGVQEKKG